MLGEGQTPIKDVAYMIMEKAEEEGVEVDGLKAAHSALVEMRTIARELLRVMYELMGFRETVLRAEGGGNVMSKMMARFHLLFDELEGEFKEEGFKPELVQCALHCAPLLVVALSLASTANVSGTELDGIKGVDDGS